jgi:dihydrofolate synthase/folylpolyglutamate synthase
MYGKLPMYQRQGKRAFKKSLDNILLFDAYLGYPSHSFKSIHIGGTNGKGSVSHMLASVLQEAGYTTGLYTSPHLKDFRERIRLNGQMIHKNSVIGFIRRHRAFLEQNNLSFFEMTVGMAFDYFSRKQVDIAVVEVGLGGRLDSTNILQPLLSIITHISMDHTDMLGDSLDKIAREKAGIIKPHIPVIIGRKQRSISHIFEQVAKEKNAPIYYAGNTKTYSTSLLGEYQSENVATVVKAVEILQQSGYILTEENLIEGLRNVVNRTGIRGRFEILHHNPLVIADTAHNPGGLSRVLEQVQKMHYRQLHIVLGVVKEKNLGTILSLLPSNAQYYFTRPDVPRGLDEEELRIEATGYALKGNTYSTVKKAFQTAMKSADKKDVILITGSNFVVAEVI